MDRNAIPKATLGRLPRYLEYLKTLSCHGLTSISATTISKNLCLGEVQVRKDLNAVSGAGKPRIGYEIQSLIRSLEDVLGQSRFSDAVLVGAGKLGKALLEFDEFEKYGVRIIAAFDSNDQVIKIGSRKVLLPMSEFKTFCEEHNVQIGIITVGEGSAQTVCNIMTDCGIKAIWNFAPCKLNIPEGVVIQQENLALSLAHLNYQLVTKH